MIAQPEAPAPYALVVDDDALLRMDVVDILSQAGFRTYEARDADDAIDLLQIKQASVVLIFSDVEMPGSRNGFELVREVARCWPHIAIVVASGRMKPGPDDMPEGARFIGKPFSVATIHHHIQEILPDGQKPKPLKS